MSLKSFTKRAKKAGALSQMKGRKQAPTSFLPLSFPPFVASSILNLNHCKRSVKHLRVHRQEDPFDAGGAATAADCPRTVCGVWT